MDLCFKMFLSSPEGFIRSCFLDSWVSIPAARIATFPGRNTQVWFLVIHCKALDWVLDEQCFSFSQSILFSVVLCTENYFIFCHPVFCKTEAWMGGKNKMTCWLHVWMLTKCLNPFGYSVSLTWVLWRTWGLCWPPSALWGFIRARVLNQIILGTFRT